MEALQDRCKHNTPRPCDRVREARVTSLSDAAALR
jgi:hypothetical protein